jgi:hypothetical protein
MKSLKLLLVLSVLFSTTHSFSQSATGSIESLPINKKTNCFIRYYYYPNLQAYFDNLKMVYYFKQNGEWQTAAEIPENYGGYSLYNKLRVSLTDYDGENPQQFLKIHKKKYPYNSKGRFISSTASRD